VGHAFVGDVSRYSASNRGANNARSILSVEQVDEILTSREPARTLAKLFGVDKSTVSRIRQGRSWGHHTPPGCLYRKGGRDGMGTRAKVRAKNLPPDAPRLKRPSEM
jgi:hypothetical protein